MSVSDSNISGKDNPKKGHILFVDDDKMFLKLMKKIFEKHYYVTTAESGEIALTKLEDDYKPAVIISDHLMPGTNGSEFLEKSVKYSPNSIRILLTGQSNPTKDIIQYINQAKAFLYLTKPIEEFQIVLVVKIAFENYNSKIYNKKQIDILNHYIDELKKRHSEHEKNSSIGKLQVYHAIQLIAGLHNESKNIFFANPTKFITNISVALGELMGFDNDALLELALASQLFCLISASFPSEFYWNSPYEFDNKKDQQKYFELFLSAQIPFFGNSFCINAISIVSQIWEHNDGSGLPFHLTGTQISKEANIISLANLYFTSVYRLTSKLHSKLKSDGSVSQDLESSHKRHFETIKMLHKKSEWFDQNVYQSFVELIRKRSCPELVPQDEKLIIYDYDKLSSEGSEDSDLRDSETSGESDLASDEENNSEQIDFSTMKEIELKISDIESGMLIIDSVNTKQGVLVVKPRTIVDSLILKKLKTLEASGNFNTKIKVMAPVNN